MCSSSYCPPLPCRVWRRNRTDVGSDNLAGGILGQNFEDGQAEVRSSRSLSSPTRATCTRGSVVTRRALPSLLMIPRVPVSATGVSPADADIGIQESFATPESHPHQSPDVSGPGPHR